MNCREYRDDLIEIARGGDAPAAARHAVLCGRCAEFLDQQRALTMTLAEIAAEPCSIPDCLPVRQRRNPVWWVGAGAVAAALLLGWLAAERTPVHHAIPRPGPRMAGVQAAPRQIQTKPTTAHLRRTRKPRPEAPFIQIPYTEALSPGESAQILSVDMPAAALIAAGYPLDVPDPGAQALADILVGQDGRARAIRVISIYERSIER
jgi:hypothetical protein